MNRKKSIELFWPGEIPMPGPGDCLTLSKAAALIPGHAGGSTSKSTLQRWIRDGVFPVRRVGQRYVTSRAAVEWFLDAQPQVAMTRSEKASKRLAGRGA